MTGSSNVVLTDVPETAGRLEDDVVSGGDEHRDHRDRSPRMRVLHVLSSSNQLYSGIGRNLFELASRMSDRATFEFAIDDHVERTVDLLQGFCDRHGLVVHVGKGRSSPDSLDVLNMDLPDLLGQDRWHAIECLCWANSSTNDCVLEHKGEAILGYTPHNQPTWSVPMSSDQADNTERVHRRMLLQSDVVFCDSPWERRDLQECAPDRGHCVYLPIGCRFEYFHPGGFRRRPQLLFVGDLAEPRKRIDRVLAVFARLRQRRPELRLVLAGNCTEQARDRVPAELRPACEFRGYVSEAELRQAYAESLGLLLLSDFEAFGIPILESLACGTPVFLSRLEATRSLFEPFKGAHFCPADNLDETVAVIERTIARGADAILEAIHDRDALRREFDWDALAEQKWNALAAAWYQKSLTQSWSWWDRQASHVRGTPVLS